MMNLDSPNRDPLISIEMAQKLYEAGEAIFIDATYFAASEPLIAADLYAQSHLPQARFFNIEAISKAGASAPHMLPGPEEFAPIAAAMGLSDKTLIVYDRPKLRSAPRVWWSLRYYGYTSVCVLDGGYEAWAAAGLPLESGEPEILPTASEILSPRVKTLVEMDQVIAAAQTGSAVILDARPAARFNGTQGDSWTKRLGHIRGSHNIAVSALLTSEGRLKPKAELAEVLEPLTKGRSVITTCGSGIAASSLALALAVIGHEDYAVYDGSWAEWGNSPLTEALTVTPSAQG